MCGTYKNLESISLRESTRRNKNSGILIISQFNNNVQGQMFFFLFTHSVRQREQYFKLVLGSSNGSIHGRKACKTMEMILEQGIGIFCIVHISGW